MDLFHVYERVYGYEPATTQFHELLEFYEEYRSSYAKAEKELKELKAENEALKKFMKDHIEEEKQLKIQIRRLRDELTQNDENR